MYDFDTIIDRTGTGSFKWDTAPAAAKQAGTMPLSIADMEFCCPPEVREAIRRAADHGIYGYTLPDKAYFDALSGFLRRRHDCEIERSSLLVTNGVVSALGLAVRALCEPGEGVLIQPPVYAPFFDAIVQNGRKPYFNELVLWEGRYEIDFAEFEHLCAKENVKLFILCSPHNPVGRVWTQGELSEMARICKANGVWIFSDEIHADLVFAGHTHTTMLNIPEAYNQCAVGMAMSKTFNLAGLSCSELIVPNEQMRSKIAAEQSLACANGMTYFARAASIAAHTECDAWLDELNVTIAGNYALLDSFLRDNLPLLTCARMEGTYLAWVDMRALGLSNAQLRDFCANEANLSLTMGDWFGIGGSGFTRWNIALPREVLAALLERFAAAVRRHMQGWQT